MREMYRNPMLYYLFIPVLVAIWPLLVWGLYLPRSERNWERDQKQYDQATAHILDILDKDPDRLKVTEATKDIGKFTYAEAVDRVANLCRIPSGNLNLSANNIVTTRGKETQEASVDLTNINIVQGAKFLSTIQAMWIPLTCKRVELTKKDGMPDQWDMDLSFRYDY